MASSITTPLSFSGCDSSHVKAICLPSTNFNPVRKTSALNLRSKSSNRIRTISVSARKNSGSSDFVTGFLLGSAVFGTMAYIFAPQIRKSLLNENEYGFKKPKQPKYYEEGLEERREVLNEKISQLNSAIDNVSSRLRSGGSGKNGSSSSEASAVAVENDSEAEATA